MLTLNSFLQKVRRSGSGMLGGCMVFTAVAFTSSGFGGVGSTLIAAHAETRAFEEMSELPVEEAEEMDLITEAKIQVGLTDSRREGQLLAGDLLVKDITEKQENKKAAKAEAEQKKEEFLTQRAEEEKRLEEELARKEAARISYTEEDYQVFLRIVQAEAGICDEKGKILVANVILNRVRSNKFPNNITDVVYQRGQFSPVSNGSINRVKVSEETIECVQRALDGEDYSQGALYFMNRKASYSGNVGWFDNQLTYLFGHGSHEFFK